MYMTKTATDYTGTDKGSASDADNDGTIVVTNKDNSKTQYTYNKDMFTVEKSFKAKNGSLITATDATVAKALDGDNLDDDGKVLRRQGWCNRYKG